MPQNGSAIDLDATSARDLHALVPRARQPEAPSKDGPLGETTGAAAPAAPDETGVYIAELIAKAPPLPAKVARLLRHS